MYQWRDYLLAGEGEIVRQKHTPLEVMRNVCDGSLSVNLCADGIQQVFGTDLPQRVAGSTEFGCM